MTHTVTVTTWQTVGIEFRPDIDMDEMIAEFSACIFPVDSEDDLIKFIAEQVARYGTHFCEGVGQVEYDYGQGFQEGVQALFVLTTDDIETEIVA